MESGGFSGADSNINSPYLFLNSSVIDQQFNTVAAVRKTPKLTSMDFLEDDHAIATIHPQCQNARSTGLELSIPVVTPLQRGVWLVIIHNSENSF
jgi:hypothetical protein